MDKTLIILFYLRDINNPNNFDHASIKDISNRSYVTIPMKSGHLRITLIPQGWIGAEAIRISTKGESGHLRQGAEIPVAQVADLAASTTEWINKYERK